ncbi:MAG: DUF2218 domain-containing protein [Cohaesibacter sp.]|nr:DUF2218 domain-containing protein [Cohaesibacter sp.]
MQHHKALVTSDKASRYLQQMCKHFAHKVPSTFDETQGRVEFPFGLCVMSAKDDVLEIVMQTESEEALLQARGVLDSHFERFAWKEELSLRWE